MPQGQTDASGHLWFEPGDAELIREYARAYRPSVPGKRSSAAKARSRRFGPTLPATTGAGVYLDANATTQVLPEVVHQLTMCLQARPGNAASIHSAGEFYRTLISTARSAIEDFIQAPYGTVHFTSGGTESNNLAIQGSVLQGFTRVVTSQAEHSSILNALPHAERIGADIVIIDVNREGIVDLRAIQNAVGAGNTVLSFQWVNPETGVVQPIEALVEIASRSGNRLHVDGAQALGKLPIDVTRTPIDLLSLVGHKIHAPAGIGALYVRPGTQLSPVFGGGDQERGVRPGTENILGIVGFGAAVMLRRQKLEATIEYLRSIRDHFESAVMRQVPDVVVNGAGADRVCNTSNLRFQGVDGQALVARLDQRGIQCSQSSACTSQRPEPSHVLIAMGLTEEEAYSSVRFSFSELNTHEEVALAVRHLAELCEELRGLKQALAAKYRE